LLRESPIPFPLVCGPVAFLVDHSIPRRFFRLRTNPPLRHFFFSSLILLSDGRGICPFPFFARLADSCFAFRPFLARSPLEVVGQEVFGLAVPFPPKSFFPDGFDLSLPPSSGLSTLWGVILCSLVCLFSFFFVVGLFFVRPNVSPDRVYSFPSPTTHGSSLVPRRASPSALVLPFFFFDSNLFFPVTLASVPFPFLWPVLLSHAFFSSRGTDFNSRETGIFFSFLGIGWMPRLKFLAFSPRFLGNSRMGTCFFWVLVLYFGFFFEISLLFFLSGFSGWLFSPSSLPRVPVFLPL